jgi:pimeloyl-ACP methyl ester carboxylesterase
MPYEPEDIVNTQYLDCAGGRIAYDLTGDPAAPLIVCAPSMGDLRAEYRFLVPQLLRAGYRVATMDLRGLGASSVAWPDYGVAAVGSDMLAIARHLGAGPAILIGDSMAGGAAVWAAAEAPTGVAGLVLIDPFVRDFPSPGHAASHARLLPLLSADPWGASMWVRYYASLYPGRRPADFGAYKSALAANLREPGRLNALRQMLHAPKSASEAALVRVHAPTLILMGTRDPDFKDPAGEARWIGERLPATVHLIQGAGHYPHAEMPDECGAAILEFLSAVPVGAARVA